MDGNKIGYISQIYNGSAVDGPGLRCVVFLTGCNLRCPFCHNPETFERHSGKPITAEQTISRVLRYRAFIASGGVTFSGGEPFLQPEYVLKCIKLLKQEGIHCAVQTNATVVDTRLIEAADLIIADIKNFDGNILPQTVRFLQECSKAGREVWATNVITAGVNDGKDQLAELKKLVTAHSNISKMTFLPFKKYCTQKYIDLGMTFPYADQRETMPGDIKKVEQIYASITP